MSADSFSDIEPAGLRADARRNRARVLKAAQEAFAAEGLAVPLDEIARRAGVGAGTVYRHFPTKEALFETIVLGRVREMGERARRWVDADDPGQGFFLMLDEIVEQGVLKKDLVDALTSAGVDISDTLAEARIAIRDAIRTVLTRAQAAGAVRPDVNAADVQALLSGLFLASRLHEPGGTAKAAAVIADGLRARPAGPEHG